MSAELNAGEVDRVFRDCLFESEQDIKDPVIVEGIMVRIGFDPAKLKVNTAAIVTALNELPNEFKSEDQGGGGGMSFLNACVDRHGNQWGEHVNMEQLFLLGTAIGKVKTPFPKSMWSALPGGMPYYVVNT